MEDGPVHSITAASVPQVMRDDQEFDYESQHYVPQAGADHYPEEYPIEQDVPRKLLALSQVTKVSTQSMLERDIFNYCSDDDEENLL